MRKKLIALVKRAITDWKHGDVSEKIADHLIQNGVAIPVHCRDCINYNTMGCSNGFGWCEAWQQGRADESFCDCGERKDNG